ncbi:MAG: Unknown protein [uncultured Sulfurovum sp.]|uniref:DUF481 domain-containing protein n=1 Tax=uncultured Sulfurovum sp. TaxID=269237 RepID=A0A6S6UBB1_9BACT|nr:MAG: Unknown protein [uncultured Sulfurovum sp.]
MFKKSILLFCMLTMYAQAFINIEAQIIGEKEKGFEGEVSLEAQYNSGNTNTQSIGFSAKAQYDAEDWLSFVIASYSYEEANDERNKDHGLLHWRYINHIEDTAYDWELFLQDEYNELQNIKTRALAGAGFRRGFDTYFDKFYVGLGLFYSYMEPQDITDEDLILKRVKVNSYISLKKTFSERFFVTYVGYLQPNVEDVSDYTMRHTMQFNTPLTKSLLLSLDLDYQYNATPYSGVKKDDFSSILNLKFKF